MSREKLSDSPLKKVVWQAVIDGPLMSYTSSQQYHNDSKDPVEINYSFPLPYGKSVISKFRANINGVVREARLIRRKKQNKSMKMPSSLAIPPSCWRLLKKIFAQRH